ncbi:hypothetical protein KA001_02625 [Patescibacteria group bacterium]|nr:hypothetical protein [Patescibacteria group bacterium]
MKFIFNTAIFFLILFVFTCPKVFAQSDLGIGVARYIQISEKVEDGDIISVVGNTYKKTSAEYDPQMVGVVNLRPAVSFEYNITENSYPILNVGEIRLKVSNSNGQIKKGDVLTSSTIPGVAMKSSRIGFVLATALEDYPEADTKKVGIIKSEVNIRYSYSGIEIKDSGKVQKTFADVFTLSSIATYESPIKAFKYLMAAILLILSIIFGFFVFGRIASFGVEAMGRNPLARNVIGFSILVNVVITVAIIGGGVFVAYLILVL